jgi:hypothetical protein
VITPSSRDYNRRYARTRRFLYRLAHPAKTRGRKPGQKDTRPRMLGQKDTRPRMFEDKRSSEVESIRQKFGWTIPAILLPFLLLFTTTRLPAADLPCFHVTRAVPAISNDSGRYLIETVSNCRGSLPSVYLVLRFVGGRNGSVETWESFHFVLPGKHRHELAYPVNASGFVNVILLSVTDTLPSTRP